MINCIIIDDEKHARIELIYHLSKYKNINISADFDNGVDAINYIKENNIDLIFLDINMTTQNGIDIVKSIHLLNFEIVPHIVFVTAYDQYAIEAYNLNVIDYILKPINEKRFNQCIEKISKKINISINNNSSYQIKNDEKEIISLIKNNILYPIKKSNIKLAYIKDRLLIIETEKHQFSISTTLNEFEENLPNNIFFKVHRSYLININYIEKIIPWFNSTYKVKLIGLEIEIPVSRNQTQNFKKRMNII